jgi:hypothetical protein
MSAFHPLRTFELPQAQSDASVARMSRWWFAALVLIAAVIREVILRAGYSWVPATTVAMVLMLALFLFLGRRSLGR